MLRIAIKKILSFLGIDRNRLHIKLSTWSLHKAAVEQGLVGILEQLCHAVPNISKQESREVPDSVVEYVGVKRRLLHSYQLRIMTRLLDPLGFDVRVVDIGDSAGTHCLYFRKIFQAKHNIKTLSVNLDPRAIKKIKARGLPALLKRAEEITPEDLGGNIDVFTCFEMLEHLHNPALFLRRLADSPTGAKLFITVPFLRKSRIGLRHIRQQCHDDVYAEDVHIFELSPSDWTLLFMHSGWKVVDQGICYQYPRRMPIVSHVLKAYWKLMDFEGFWGAVLERDMTYSKRYMDWEVSTPSGIDQSKEPTPQNELSGMPLHRV